jgi:hypothetical protein
MRSSRSLSFFGFFITVSHLMELGLGAQTFRMSSARSDVFERSEPTGFGRVCSILVLDGSALQYGFF